MSVRSTVLAASFVALSLGLRRRRAGKDRVATASATSPTDTAPTTPTNLRITASGPNSISLAWNAASRQLEQLVVLRAA